MNQNRLLRNLTRSVQPPTFVKLLISATLLSMIVRLSVSLPYNPTLHVLVAIFSLLLSVYLLILTLSAGQDKVVDLAVKTSDGFWEALGKSLRMARLPLWLIVAISVSAILCMMELSLDLLGT